MKSIVMDPTYAGTSTKTSTICWRSALAGLLISLFAFTGLLALGMAFGGIGLEDGSTLQNAGIFAGVWFLVSAVISIFLGSFFSASVARRTHTHIGATQGLLVAALFFAVLLWQTASVVGWIGRAAGKTVVSTASAVGAGATSAANSPVVQEIVEDSMGDLKISPDRVQVIVTGVATRLLNGRPEAAKNYLSRQTGITPADAEQRLATLKTQVDQAIVQAREATAAALKTTGWTLFLILVLGAMASAIGGALASYLNSKNTLIVDEDKRTYGRLTTQTT